VALNKVSNLLRDQERVLLLKDLWVHRNQEGRFNDQEVF
jgi:hypothetical protein